MSVISSNDNSTETKIKELFESEKENIPEYINNLEISRKQLLLAVRYNEIIQEHNYVDYINKTNEKKKKISKNHCCIIT